MDEDDFDTDSKMGIEDGDIEDEIPLFARFLSFTVYSNGTTCDEQITIPAHEFWDAFKTWAKRNNFKMKQNAAELRASLLQYSKNKHSGFAMSRNAKDKLMVTCVPSQMFHCLQKLGMLDSNVW
jgi:hypothetical protein